MSAFEKTLELFAHLDGDAPKPHAPLGLTHDAREEIANAVSPEDADALRDEIEEMRAAVGKLQRQLDDLRETRETAQMVACNLAFVLGAAETQHRRACSTYIALITALDEARRRAFTLAHSSDPQAVAAARMRTPITRENG